MDHYAELGVSANATGDEIRRAYLGLARHYHPDRLLQRSETERAAGEQRMQEVNRAYAVLGDHKARTAYDLGRTAKTPSQPPRSAPPSSGRSRSQKPSPEAEPRDWRSYASPGSGAGARPFHERLLTISPMLFAAGALAFGFLGMLLRVRFLLGLAVGLFVFALVSVLLLPLFFMATSRRNELRGTSSKSGHTRQG